MLLGLYLLLVIALPLALGAIVLLNGLPRNVLCPACAGETLRLRSRRHSLLSRLLRREELHARWCPSCEWAGTTLLPRPVRTPAVSRPAADTRIAAKVCDAGVEVRRLDLDGGAWHVRLECWAEDASWHGRLLFIGPGGRAWTDGRGLLTGPSPVAVLSQVLSLPEEALAGRIRQATR